MCSCVKHFPTKPLCFFTVTNFLFCFLPINIIPQTSSVLFLTLLLALLSPFLPHHLSLLWISTTNLRIRCVSMLILKLKRNQYRLCDKSSSSKPGRVGKSESRDWDQTRHHWYPQQKKITKLKQQ